MMAGVYARTNLGWSGKPCFGRKAGAARVCDPVDFQQYGTPAVQKGRAAPRSGDALVAVMEPADFGDGADRAV